MRTAFTFNLCRGRDESEAEFDTPETVAFIAGALERLGHEVELVDAGLPVADLVERLRLAAPALVFNTAEGRAGRYREAFFPALYEELGLLYTGSDAWTCAVTLDKRLSKLVARGVSVATPAARLVLAPEEIAGHRWDGPVIVKPNFEGSSKGIDASAVVSDAQLVAETVERALHRFPAGVLVEDFVAGRDISVAFLEPVGVLAAVEYEFADPTVSIYGYELKNERPEDVQVRAPARLELEQADELARAATTIFGAFSVRDVARADFRLAEDGKLWFLEVNPLPSLEEDAGIYAAAALAGLDADGVIGAILDSAVRRRGDAVVR